MVRESRVYRAFPKRGSGDAQRKFHLPLGFSEPLGGCLEEVGTGGNVERLNLLRGYSRWRNGSLRN